MEVRELNLGMAVSVPVKEREWERKKSYRRYAHREEKYQLLKYSQSSYVIIQTDIIFDQKNKNVSK